ncbi:MAG: hypothetical protein R3B35_13615 [Gemmatimonadales bacterium]
MTLSGRGVRRREDHPLRGGIVEYLGRLLAPAVSMVVLCTTAACTEPSVDVPAGSAIRRDSAGIEIVENAPARHAGIAVSFDSSPAFEIGGISRDPDTELSTRASHDIAFLPDGGIVVSNGHQVRLHDADGSLRAMFGRQGEGPGAFTAMIWSVCVVPPDTILAVEVPAPRVTALVGDLQFVSTSAFTGRGLPRGCVRDGFITSNAPFERIGEEGTTSTYVVRGADGVEKRTIGELPGSNYAGIFAREAGIAGVPGGFVAADGRAFEYRRYDDEGVLRAIVRTRDTVAALSDDAVADLVSRRLGASVPAAQRRVLVAQAVGQMRDSTVPAFIRLETDNTGRVWLSEPRMGPGLEAWTVFDATGQLLGRAEPSALGFPPESRAQVARWSDSLVVIKYLDDDGAVRLSGFRFRVDPTAP